MTSIKRQFRSVAICSVLFVPSTQLGAQQPAKLGTISFPNSGNAAAQAPFIRGMLLLHSFEYGTAAESFRSAQKADPAFALAYAGEALTYTHQVWNEQDLAAARAALGRLAPDAATRKAKAPTHREQMYMDAVEALYGEGSKPRRDTLFMNAIERITRAHPDDDEAKVYLAAALLGLNQGVRDFTSYMKAGAIAEDVLRRNPDHPAAAHFVIHAFDDPIHAPLGLWAARAYSKIAPAAPHAQHMTTHIFVAMGMWDDVVSQNVIASGPASHEHWQAGHYTSWLGYGYLQQGRYTDARAHLEMMKANLGHAPRRGEQPSLLSMRAHYIVNSERWNDPIVNWTLDLPEAGPVAQAMDAFASAYAALKRGDRKSAEQYAAALTQRAAGTTKDDFYGGNPTVSQILGAQMRAQLLAADGKVDSAIVILRKIASAEDAIPSEFGPPDIVKPTHEMLGEVLLAAGKAAEAQGEFTRALALAPGRSRALLGLARAASKAGDGTTAQRAAAELQRNWKAADKDAPEVTEVEKLIRG